MESESLADALHSSVVVPPPSLWRFLFVSNTEWLGATSSPGGCRVRGRWADARSLEAPLLHPAGNQKLGPWGDGSMRLTLCTFPV